MQNQYNLRHNEEERALNNFCNENRVRLIPWGPLFSALLAKAWRVASARSKTSVAMSGEFMEVDETIN